MANKKRIAFVLNGNSPSFRNHMFLATLRNQGYEIIVIVREEVAEGKDKATRSEDGGNKRIILQVAEGKGSAGRYAKLLKQTLRNIRAGVDIVYFTHLSQIKPFIFKRPEGFRFIYDATETSIPEFDISARPIAMLAERVVEMVERKVLKMTKMDGLTASAARSDHIDAFKQAIPKSSVVRTVPAIAQSASDQDRSQAARKIGKKRVVAVVGDITAESEMEFALAVAENVTAAYKDVIFLFFGKPYCDPIGLKKMLSQNPVEDHVHFLNPPYRKMMAYLENARVGLSIDLGLGKTTISQKSMSMFSYMQAALPVVGHAGCAGGVTARKVGCGMFVDTANPVEVSGSVAYLLSNPEEAKKLGGKGRKAFMSTYNWEYEMKNLTNVLDG